MISLLISVFLSANQALACACCSEPGTYYRGERFATAETMKTFENLELFGVINQGFGAAGTGLSWLVSEGKIKDQKLTFQLKTQLGEPRGELQVQLSPVWHVVVTDLFNDGPSDPHVLQVTEIPGVPTATHPEVSQWVDGRKANLVFRAISNNACNLSPQNWVLHIQGNANGEEDLFGHGRL